ncbi:MULTISPECIES: cysteine dioxygenase [Kordiimonas]|jgi:predicted metal-dependent enzyme (double-stranded beta helix superfamily)|uniref:cysteine dioxygenase n=1 Tax=Kordiimonas TaxID=288021 RepID=UPI00257FDA6D|nr:cysteine dioxygenase family protein [Kordiimonas sp. UBA4487]
MPKEGIPSFQSTINIANLVQEACTAVACAAPDCHKDEIAHLMEHVLPRIELEDFADTPVNARGYRRKVLYAHPSGFFSVLQLEWQPGAETPVHGHNAWGCVGVISGEIGCETYDRCNASEGGVRSNGKIMAGAGAVATVNPNPEGIHRLFNPTDKVATTLHIYGMDLSANPCAINVPYGSSAHRN